MPALLQANKKNKTNELFPKERRLPGDYKTASAYMNGFIVSLNLN
jgi:hypothetical protein